MRSWYTASDLAELPGMGASPRAVSRQAAREGWTSRKRKGRGGGREYSLASLPVEAQEALISIAEPTGAAKSRALEDLIARECRKSGVWATARRVLVALWRGGRHA